MEERTPLASLTNQFYSVSVSNPIPNPTPTHADGAAIAVKRRVRFSPRDEHEPRGPLHINPFYEQPSSRRKSAPSRISDIQTHTHALPETPYKPRTHKGGDIHDCEPRFTQDFEVLDVIGSGHFGTVYRVQSKVDGMPYAVKRTRRNLRGSDFANTLHEVYALAVITDTSTIVRYYSSWVQDDYVYIQLELCEDDLESALIRQDVFEYAEVCRIVRDILLALQVLHTNHLVHLDVKPGNILIKNGRYKLGDFGLAVNSKLDRGSVVEGDSRYMAPELLNDDVDNLTKCDIFSLGITSYEVIMGYGLPSNGPQWVALRSGLSFETLATHTHDIREVIIQMMNPDPIERPETHGLLSMPLLSSELERELLFTKHVNESLRAQLTNTHTQVARSRLRRVNTIT